MPDDKENFSFTQKIKELTNKEKYSNPKISPEGYGSFTSTNSHFGNNNNATLALDSNERADLISEIKTALEVLRETAKVDRKDIQSFVISIRKATKHVEKAIQLSKTYNAETFHDIMERVFFNLKFLRITNETFILHKGQETENYAYLMKELRLLHSFFTNRKTKYIEIGDIPEIIEIIENWLNLESKSLDSKAKCD